MRSFYDMLENRKKRISYEERVLSNNQKSFLDDNLDELLSELVNLREQIDNRLLNEGIKIDFPNYPYGNCNIITHEVYDLAMKSNTLLSLLKRRGFIVKEIFGIDGKEYFSNRMQVGDKSVDVAVDSALPSEFPIKIENFSISGFKQIENYHQILGIYENAWKSEVYPNLYFPSIAPIFPYLLKRAKGIMYISEEHISTIIPEEVKSSFSDATSLLLNSEYSNKILPEQDIQKLFEVFNGVELWGRKVHLIDPRKSDFREGFLNVLSTRANSSSIQNFDSETYTHAMHFFHMNRNKGVIFR
jgi:hypothetical protein